MKITSLAAQVLAVSILAGCAVPAHVKSAAAETPTAAADQILAKPAQDDLYLGIVNGLIKQGRYQAALAFLDQYSGKGTPSARYHLLRGDALVGAQQYEAATLAFTLALKSDFAAEAYSGLGRANGGQEHWAAAIENFRHAADLDPSNAQYLNNLGYARLQQQQVAGQLRQARADLEKAHELEPGSTNIRNNLILAAAMSADQAQVSALLKTIADVKERADVAKFTTRWIADQNQTSATKEKATP